MAEDRIQMPSHVRSQGQQPRSPGRRCACGSCQSAGRRRRTCWRCRRGSCGQRFPVDSRRLEPQWCTGRPRRRCHLTELRRTCRRWFRGRADDADGGRHDEVLLGVSEARVDITYAAIVNLIWSKGRIIDATSVDAPQGMATLPLSHARRLPGRAGTPATRAADDVRFLTQPRAANCPESSITPRMKLTGRAKSRCANAAHPNRFRRLPQQRTTRGSICTHEELLGSDCPYRTVVGLGMAEYESTTDSVARPRTGRR